MEYMFLSKNVSIKKVSETPSWGVFEVSGLYAGYGVTLGNAFRRVLLSSLPGAAITQVKVKGVKHEFSTIPDVLEDVVDVTLNLKKIRFSFYADEPQILTLKHKGAGAVTASAIKANSQVEIVNPDCHIATLTSKSAELDLELTVEKGLGYSPAETRKIEKLPIGSIAIDAIFSPVTMVNFEVENMRVGDRTDYNKLRLVIETDSTLMPGRALHKAANILRDHVSVISEIEQDENEAKKHSLDEEGDSDLKEKKSRKTKVSKK